METPKQYFKKLTRKVLARGGVVCGIAIICELFFMILDVGILIRCILGILIGMQTILVLILFANYIFVPRRITSEQNAFALHAENIAGVYFGKEQLLLILRPTLIHPAAVFLKYSELKQAYLKIADVIVIEAPRGVMTLTLPLEGHLTTVKFQDQKELDEIQHDLAQSDDLLQKASIILTIGALTGHTKQSYTIPSGLSTSDVSE